MDSPGLTIQVAPIAGNETASADNTTNCSPCIDAPFPLAVGVPQFARRWPAPQRWSRVDVKPESWANRARKYELGRLVRDVTGNWVSSALPEHPRSPELAPVNCAAELVKSVEA